MMYTNIVLLSQLIIKLIRNVITVDCYYGFGVGYRGNLNVTRSGRSCQSWTSQCPHRHWRIPEDVADGQNNSNACRNPDSSAPDGPWCYTTDPNVRWEYCNVSKCPPRGISNSLLPNDKDYDDLVDERNDESSKVIYNEF